MKEQEGALVLQDAPPQEDVRDLKKKKPKKEIDTTCERRPLYDAEGNEVGSEVIRACENKACCSVWNWCSCGDAYCKGWFNEDLYDKTPKGCKGYVPDTWE